ncbi:unnamed protein product [Polarella glacialis]|uniref:Uncharacterized protein n=1 Tax=Polarella glacialis TaxID=89957 RepID=A0A813HHP9_POLGL|nr:unnamed protein product [Polarella glacialis]
MGSSSSQPEPQSSFFSMSTPEADLEHQSLQTQMQRQHRQPAMSGCCTGGRKAHKEAVNSNASRLHIAADSSVAATHVGILALFFSAFVVTGCTCFFFVSCFGVPRLTQ